jgi:hypothetical protein
MGPNLTFQLFYSAESVPTGHDKNTFLTVQFYRMGAQTQLWAATTAPEADINGQVCIYVAIHAPASLILPEYLIPWARVADAGVASKMSQSVGTETMLIECMRSELKGF